MNTIYLAIGSDHRGYAHKQYLLGQPGISWQDQGAFSDERSDYPDYAFAVVQALLKGSVRAGVLLCASGQGMAIAANRIPGIRAAIAWNDTIGRLAKEDDHANILVIPTVCVSPPEAWHVIQVWLHAHEKGGRYADRLIKLEEQARVLLCGVCDRPVE